MAALTLALASLGLSRLNAAVTLSWFKATAQEDCILLAWETATELNTLGFYVLRGTDVNGPFNQGSRINPIPIPAKSLEDGGFVLPHQYEYRDRTALPGVTYFYVLEELDASGGSHLYLEYRDSATLGAPSSTATTTPTVTTTPMASATLTRTPLFTVTPTQTPVLAAAPTKSPTATLLPPTSTPLVLGGLTVTPPPRPTDRPPAPTNPPANVQPTATSQPAVLSPTRSKPTQQPTHPAVGTSVQPLITEPAELLEMPTLSPEALQPTPAGAQPAIITLTPREVHSATPSPSPTASTVVQPEEPPLTKAGGGGTVRPASPVEGSSGSPLVWKLGGALAVGGLALMLLRLLRPAA